MPLDSATRQQLLELVYDLLPEAEAAELRGRIAADEELAQAHREAQAAAGLLAQAARHTAPALDYPRLRERAVEASPRAKAAARIALRRGLRRTLGMTWAVTAAAMVLLTVSLGGYLYHRHEVSGIAQQHLRLVLAGPARLQAGAPSVFNVATSDVQGRPVVAEVELAVYSPLGRQLMRQKEQTDERGQLQLTVPAEVPGDVHPQGEVRLEVEAVAGRNTEKLETSLPVAPWRPLAHLTHDKPAYRPGEAVQYRGLLLAPFSLEPAAAAPLEVEVRDPAGRALAGSRATLQPERGVASGSFLLPADAPAGTYELTADSPHGLLAPCRAKFQVQTAAASGPQVEIAFPRDGYRPGEKAVALASISPVRAGLHLTAEATVDGQPVYHGAPPLSAEGNARITLTLPRRLARGEGTLNVTLVDGLEKSVQAAPIPIELGRVDLRFYPEGGELAPGLPNRVYFQARTPQGRPLAVRGIVLDSRDEQVATVETAEEGRGLFSFTPAVGEQYRVKLAEPAGISEDPRLPPVAAEQRVAINTGPGVFAAGEPVALDVYATRDHLPLVVVAWCRGVQVGQQTLVTDSTERTAAQHVVLPLPPEAAGVIRLTAYDFRTSRPRAVAERLVFRRPLEQLELALDEEQLRCRPGQDLNLTVNVRNERNAPVPAQLSYQVLDEASAAGPAVRPRSDLAYVLLASELEHPQGLPDTDSYLRDDPHSAFALDLLLGTQGWRRFAQRTLDEQRSTGPVDPRLAQVAAESGSGQPPLVQDNLGRIREQYQERLKAYRAQQTRLLDSLTAVSFFGGFALVLFVAMLALLNVISGTRLWVPALGAAVSCVIIGAVLMDPDRLHPGREATVAFASYALPSPEAVPAPEAAAETRLAESRLKAERTERKDTAGAEAEAEPAPAKQLAMDKLGVPAEKPAAAPPPAAPSSFGRTAASPPAASPAPAAAPVPAAGMAGEPEGAAPKAAAKGGRRDADEKSKSIATANRAAGAESRAMKASAGAAAHGGVEIRQQVAGQFDDSRMQQLAPPADSTLGGMARPGLAPGQAPAGSSDANTIVAGNKFSSAEGKASSATPDWYWQPNVAVDEEGHAQLRFRAPDRATRLRIQLDAYGSNRLGGQQVECEVLPAAPPEDRQKAVAQGERSPASEMALATLTGRPGQSSVAGWLAGRQELTLHTPAEALAGSLAVTLQLFPSALADVQAAAQSLDPPDHRAEPLAALVRLEALALQQIEDHGTPSARSVRELKQKLQDHVAELTKFESASGGFESSGGSPGQETLTAWVLAAARQADRFVSVGPSLLDAPQQWLLRRRDGKGLFQIAAGTRPSGPLAAAWILWCSEAGDKDLAAERKRIAALAADSPDTLLAALAAAGEGAPADDPAHKALLEKLARAQRGDGSLDPGPVDSPDDPHDVTVQTTALALLAWRALPAHATAAQRAVDWLLAERGAEGGWGSPRATLLAAEALAAQAAGQRPALEKSPLTVEQAGQRLAEATLAPDQPELLAIRLPSGLAPGALRLEVSAGEGNRLPYVLSASFRTPLSPTAAAASAPRSPPAEAARMPASPPPAAAQPVPARVDRP